MLKRIWKFSVVYTSIFGLLSTDLYGITTEEAYEKAKEKTRATAEAVRAEEIIEKEKAYAKASSDATEAINTVHKNTGVSKEALTSGDVHKVTQEQIDQASVESRPNRGDQQFAGKTSIVKAANEINASMVDEFKKDAAGNTKEGGILNKIKNATTKADLENSYKDLGEYRSQLQQDIAMLIIGQVTSRLTVCSPAPDLQLGIGAGQAFIVGEVAEYAIAEDLRTRLQDSLNNKEKDGYDKQLDTFRTLKNEYEQVLVSAKAKQELRGLSQTAFYSAAALAAAEAVEDEAWGFACTEENINMVQRGSSQGRNNFWMYVAMAAAAYAMPFCGGCAAGAIYISKRNRSRHDHNSCEQGGLQTQQNIIDRKKACDTLGNEEMFMTPNTPTTTASKTIKNRCLADGDTVTRGAGQGCSGYSRDGAPPYPHSTYPTCGKASEAYKRNMVACPVSVLTAGKMATLETSGITSEKGREFVRKASEEVSRTIDLRIASPRHRIIVWTAFGELASSAVDTNKEMIVVIEKQLAEVQRIIESLESMNSGVTVAEVLSPQTKTLTQKTKAINHEISRPDNVIFKNATSPIALVTNISKPQKNDELVSENFKLIPGFNQLPFELQTSTAIVTKALDSINSSKGLSRANFKSIDAANREQASIKNALNKKKSQLASMTSRSKDKVNIDKDSGSLLAKINNSINSSLDKNGGVLSALGKTGSALSTSGRAGSAKMNNSGSSSSDFENPNSNSNSNSNKIASYNQSDIEGNAASNALLGYKGNDFNYKSGSDLGSSSSSGGSVGDRNSSSNSAAYQNSDTLDRSNQEDNLKLANAINARNIGRKDRYNSNDEQTIFEKITNAYIRNYDKVLTKKNVKELNN